MLSAQELTVIVIVVSAFGLIFSNRLAPDLVALLVLLAFGFSGILTSTQVLAGFSSSAVMTLIGLFVITTGLDRSGVIRAVASSLNNLGAGSEVRLIVIFMAVGAALSLIMNNIAAGAVLLPAAVHVGRISKISPSKLLIPLSFGTLVGGMTTYFTTANIVLSGILETQGLERLGMWDFVPTGGLILVMGVGYMAVIGRRLLPTRSSASALVEVPSPDRNQESFRLTGKALGAVVITVGVLAVAIFDLVPLPEAMLAGAVGMVLVGCLKMNEFYEAVEWRVIFLIAGMLPISTALSSSGLAGRIGQMFTAALTGQSSLALIAGMYLLTMLITQVIGGQVTAFVIGPIAVSAALQTGTNPQAMATAVAIACSAAFLTPIAHPVNLLVMIPGGYRFGDFARVGLGLSVVAFVTLLIGMRLFWGV